jgi:hypothetical protein
MDLLVAKESVYSSDSWGSPFFVMYSMSIIEFWQSIQKIFGIVHKIMSIVQMLLPSFEF